MSRKSIVADWSRPYRVVQWATGNVGSRALRRMIEHPGMELVGTWVSNPEKIGRDAGELSGVEPVGIKATGNIEDIVTLKPDCVLYMPGVNRIDEICQLLESGANIITTRMEYQNPAGLNPTDYSLIEEACRRGNSSIHATGSNPGFLSEVLPLVLTSITRRLDCLTITEFADTSARNSPEMLFGSMMGFGARPGRKNEAMLDHMRNSFSDSLALIADALGLPCESIKLTSAQGIARKDTHIAAGIVPAGTVAATRTKLSCIRDGKPLINFEAIWYVSSDIDTTDGEEWNIRDTGWRVLIEGDTPLDVTVNFPVPKNCSAEVMPNYTAHRPVNCIPYVCAAKPGFVTTVDLPQIISFLGNRTSL